MIHPPILPPCGATPSALPDLGLALGRRAAASGMIFNIQRYSLHDGPGIRTTVFLKGCPLNCLWCHNPEGISPRREISVATGRCIECGACIEACPFSASADAGGCLPANHDDCNQCGQCTDACPTGVRQMIGKTMTVAEIMAEIRKDRMFHDQSGGGVTISGGEPLSQPAFTIGLLEACRAEGVHATLDTTGFGRSEPLMEAAGLADLVLYDLKAMDDARHLRLTGVSNRIILENLKQLDRVHRNIWIRLPIVPGFNDDLHNLRQTADFIASLRNVTLVNLLPFHRTGVDKFDRLGKAHSLTGIEAPSAELMADALSIFTDLGLPAKSGG